MAVGYQAYVAQPRVRHELDSGANDGQGPLGSIPSDIQISPRNGTVTYPSAPRDDGEGVASAAVPVRGQGAEPDPSADAEPTAFSRMARPEDSERQARRLGMRPAGPV